MSEPPSDPPQPSAFSFARVAGGIAAAVVLSYCIGGLVDSGDHRKVNLTLQAQNNAKQIWLAEINYATSNSGRVRRDLAPDAPPISWMTALLPFMDERALHQSIDFTQPFDAPANAAAFSHVVRSYTSPFVGNAPLPSGLAPAHYAGNELVFVPGLTLDEIGMADGLTHTIMLAEVNAATGAPTAWGDPANLRSTAAPINGPTGFGANGPGAVVVGFCDGRVTTFNPDIDPAVLAALGTPDGGEAVGADDF